MASSISRSPVLSVALATAVVAAPFVLAFAAASSVTPILFTGSKNRKCDDLLGAGAWLSVKVDPPGAGTFTGTNITITVTNFNGKVFDWSSTAPVTAVYAKAGSTGSYLYVYAPPATGDTGLTTPGATGNAISHIEFCYLDSGGEELAEPDVLVTKTPLATAIDAGATIGFGILVESAGVDPATSVNLTDTLPAVSGAWTVGGANATSCGIALGVLTCAFGTIPIGETRYVEITATSSGLDCGAVPNTVTVDATGDIDTTNNVASATVWVRCADVGVAKSANAASVPSGGAVGFTVVVTASGPNASVNVVLNDTLPALAGGWAVGGPDAGACAAIGAGIYLNCSFGTMASGATRTITLTGTSSAADCGDLLNLVATDSTLNLNPENDTSSATVHVACADIRVEKSADAASVVWGSPVGFSVTVTNLGPDAATGVVLNDTLPPLAGGWAIGGPDGASCTLEASIWVNCTFGTIAPSASRTFTASGTSSAADCGDLVNVAAGSASFDVSSENNADSATVHVACAEVSVEKTALDPDVVVGGAVGFTITITSTGPDAATNVTLTDTLPALAGGWSVGGANATACDPIVGGLLTCSFGTVLAGGTRTVTISGASAVADCGTLTNLVEVGATGDLDATNNSDSASLYVRCADVSVAKTADAPLVDVGGAVGFSVTATSNGPDAATNVTLSEILPALAGGWTLGGPNASACGPIESGVWLNCTFGTLAPGATRTITLTGTSTAADCGDLDNLATVTATFDTNPANDTAAAGVHVTCSEVGVLKTAVDPDVDVGGTAGFTITVASSGPDAAANVTLTDVLPVASGGWTLGGPDAASCGLASGVWLNCTFGTLAPGATRTITLTTTSALADCGDIANRATVAGATDLSAANDTSDATVHVTCADVSVAKTAVDPVVDVGDAVGFSITVTSNGPDAAENVVLNDTLPLLDGGWTVGGPNATDCAAIVGLTLVCDFGTLPAGATRTVTLSGTSSVADCGDLANLASVAARLDTDAENDSAAASVHVTCADVSVAKSAVLPVVDVGDAVGFTVTVSSNGPDAAPGVVLNDTLPALAGGWTVGGPNATECAPIVGATLLCSFGTLPAGATRTVTLSGTSSAADCGDLANLATVAAGIDTDATNDSAGASIHVTCAEVSVAKSAAAPVVDVGGAVGFTITVASGGPDAATNVTLQDVLPALDGGWTLGGADAAACDPISAGVYLNCTFPSIPAGGTRTITLTGVSTPFDCGSLPNTAIVAADVDLNPENNSGFADVHVTCADVSVEKSADAAAVNVGGAVGFTVTVTSNGPDAAADVTLNDTLPALAGGWTVGGPNATECAPIVGATLLCSFGTLPAGATRTITLTGTSSIPDCGDLVNLAAVDARIDLNATNDEDSATIHVTCADVSVEKTADDPVVGFGDAVGFAITVRSNGPDAATGVTLNDTLPALAGGWTLGGANATDCAITGPWLACDYGTVPVGGTRTVTLSGTSSAADCGDLDNVVRVAATVDVDPTNDTADASVHVTCADVSVEKTADDPVVDVGGAVGFGITVRSNGPDAATGVTLNDTLPALAGGWTVGGPNATECDPIVGATLLCAFGTVPVGGTRSITLSGTSSAADCGDLPNAARVAADLDVDPSNDTDSASVHVTCADVSVEKSADDAEVDVLDAVGFSITVTSNGPDAAEAVVLNETLPPLSGGWTVGGPDAGACDPIEAGIWLNCSFGSLASGATRTITLTGNSTAADCGDLENAVLVGARIDLDASNDTAAASVHVHCADVGVVKLAMDPIVDFGDAVGFTVTVTSVGPDPATNVVLGDVLPALAGGWTVGGPDAGACDPIAFGIYLNCAFGTLNVSETRTITLTGNSTAADCGDLVNLAAVTATADIFSANDTDSAVVHVTCADVSVEKTADDPVVDFGDAVGFTVTLSSNGPDAATGVTLNETLPALAGGWTVGGPDAGACDPIAAGVWLNCSFGTVSVNGTRTITLTGVSSAADCGDLENVAEVGADVDLFPGNDSAGASVHVTCADVSLTKTADDPVVDVGDTVGFTLTLSSNGPDVATGVTLNDTLPALAGGWTLGGANATDCAITGPWLACDYGTVPVGGTRTVTLSGTSGAADCGDLANLATASADIDLFPENDSAAASVHVTCAEVGVEKSADAPTVGFGDAVGFSVTVTSEGPDAATNVTLTETLPALAGGWTVGGPDAAACGPIANGTLTCAWATVPVGATRTITLSGTSSAADCGDLENLAGVAADVDLRSTNNSATAAIHVTCADVSVEKSADAPAVGVGGAAGFTIVVSSNGPDAATSVELSDALPALAGGWTVGGPDAAACGVSGAWLNCSWATIPAGGTRVVTLTGTTNASDCGDLENFAAVGADLDLNASNDAARASVHVTCSDVSVEKTASAASVDAGGNVTFTLTVGSHGPDDAADVELTDVLPALAGGWTLGGANATDCAIASGTLSCEWDVIPVGETRTVTVTGATSALDCGDLENAAAATGATDVNASNGDASASSHVTCADVGVEKSALAPIVGPGDLMGFTMTVTSHGPDTARNVTLADELPAINLTWSIGGPDAAWCTLTNLSLACSFGDLPSGASRTVNVTAKACVEDCRTIWNTARAAAELDVNATNDADTANVVVTCACPHTQGYWKNHASDRRDRWPVASLVLGDETYTKAQLLTVFSTPVRGDASLNLAHQLIAAKLNIEAGTNPTPIAATIAAADALLAPYAGKLPYGVKPSSAAGQAMVALAAVLDAYNNGRLTTCVKTS